MKIRIGFGYDVHRLEKGTALRLGGIDVPSEKSAVGHSDADVLIHAICDALLGAANLRDIGYRFPDTDGSYKNIDSKILLKKTFELIRAKGFLIGNIDATVCLQKPKIAAYTDRMQQSLAGCLQMDAGDISIKATTTEKLGFVGEEAGISAYAVALIEKENV